MKRQTYSGTTGYRKFSTVVSVDPGKATGVAMYRAGDTPSDHPYIRTETIDDWRTVPFTVMMMDPDLVHVEEFRVTTATAKKTAAPWSLKCFGAIEALCHQRDTKFMSSPSANKDIVTDDMLKSACLWAGKTAHERDALRHLVLVLAKMNDPWAYAMLRGGGS